MFGHRDFAIDGFETRQNPGNAEISCCSDVTVYNDRMYVSIRSLGKFQGFGTPT